MEPFYWLRDSYYRAIEIFKRVTEINKQNSRAYALLAHCYEKLGEPEIARRYSEEANKIILGYYDYMALYNYRKIKDILDEKKVRLVCMQYPVRSIEPLKNFFRDKDSIIFVDNEKVFKEALKKGSYDEYFVDMFAGDFGHCTTKGNRLLAENIADVILKEIFNK